MKHYKQSKNKNIRISVLLGNKNQVLNYYLLALGNIYLKHITMNSLLGKKL